MKQDRARFIPHIIYGIYTIYVTTYAIYNGWPSWVVETLILGLIISIAAYVIKDIWDSFGRIVIATCVWLNVIIYTIYGRPLVNILATVAVVVVLLSLYDMLAINYMSVVASIILIIVNMFVDKTFFVDIRNTALNCLQFVSLFIVEWMEIRMLKVRLEYGKTLEKSIIEQKKAEQGKDDFMANISHEIRTPLHVMCGTFERLMGMTFDPETRSAIEDADLSGKNLRNLVDNILDFTELQNNTMEISNDVYELASVINDAVSVFESWNESKKLELIVDCQADIPFKLIGDSQRIYRALLHMLNNAFKFTDKGGVILRISCRKESYGVNLLFEIEDTGIGIRPEDIENLSSVYNQVDTKRDRQNTGIGIGIAITKKLVEKMNGFFHLESRYGEGTRVTISIPQRVSDDRSIVSVNDAKELSVLLYLNMDKYYNAKIRESYLQLVKNAATGLKLPVYRCSTIDELKRRIGGAMPTHVLTAYDEYTTNKDYYDGLADKCMVIVIADSYEDLSKLSSKINILYKPFQIFTFASIMNKERKPESAKDRWISKKEIQVAGSRVLAVDDSPMNLKVVEFLLNKYGIEVDKAESGRIAIDLVMKNQYDLIFMDHMMPEMDGVECYHNIRNLPGAYPKSVPIVALTANSVSGAREMMLKEGFDDFVAKPLDKTNLERVLNKFLVDKKREEGNEVIIDDIENKSDNGSGDSTNRYEPVTEVSQTEEREKESGTELLAVEGFDWAIAIKKLGSKEKLLENINEFQDILPEMLKQLEEFFLLAQKANSEEEKKKLMDSYKVVVKNLSNALEKIGANGLADEAKHQYQVCEKYDYEELKAVHKAYVLRLRISYAKIKKMLMQ